MPGTSVTARAPWRRAIRRVTRRLYSSSSFVPRIAWRIMLAAAITSAASSASPNESTWMSSGQHLVREPEQQRVGEQDQQEPGDQRERQAQRGQHRRQHRVEDREERGDEERRAGRLERDPRHDRRRHPDRGGGDHPGDQRPQEAQPRRGRLPADLLAVGGRRVHGGCQRVYSSSRSATMIRAAASMQREVGERLREVAEVPAGVGVELLGVEPERRRLAQQALHQVAGALLLADDREGGDEPERADQERALLAGQAVVGLARCGSAGRTRARSARSAIASTLARSRSSSGGRKPKIAASSVEASSASVA